MIDSNQGLAELRRGARHHTVVLRKLRSWESSPSRLIRRRQRQHLSQGLLGEADGSEHRSLTTIRQSGVAPWGMCSAVHVSVFSPGRNSIRQKGNGAPHGAMRSLAAATKVPIHWIAGASITPSVGCGSVQRMNLRAVVATENDGDIRNLGQECCSLLLTCMSWKETR